MMRSKSAIIIYLALCFMITAARGLNFHFVRIRQLKCLQVVALLYTETTREVGYNAPVGQLNRKEILAEEAGFGRPWTQGWLFPKQKNVKLYVSVKMSKDVVTLVQMLDVIGKRMVTVIAILGTALRWQRQSAVQRVTGFDMKRNIIS